jgi:hypothetical protein
MTIKDIFSFTRVKPDGKPGVGFGVVLFVVIATMVGGLYVLHIMKFAPKKEKGIVIATPISDKVHSGGDPVEQAIVLNNSVGDDTKTTTGQSLDADYHANQANPNPPEKKTNGEGWIPTVVPKDLTTSVPQNGQIRLGQQNDQRNGDNLDNNGQPEKFFFPTTLLLASTVPSADAPVTNKPTGFVTKHYLPRGTRVPIVLMNKINTSIGALPVELAIAQDVIWNGRVQLPMGWKIFGTAAGGGNYKVNVVANMILDPTGKEYPITGMVLDLGAEAGFDGYANPNPLYNQILPTLTSSIQTFMNAAKSTVTQPTLVSGGGTSNLVANTTSYSLDAQNALLDGSAQVLTGLMNQKVSELAKMYPDGTTVPMGTAGFVLLTKPLDLTLGEVGGSSTFLTDEQAAPSPRTFNSQGQGSRNVYQGNSYQNQGSSYQGYQTPGSLPSQAPVNYGIPGSGTPTLPGLVNQAKTNPQNYPTGLE